MHEGTVCNIATALSGTWPGGQHRHIHSLHCRLNWICCQTDFMGIGRFCRYGYYIPLFPACSFRSNYAWFPCTLESSWKFWSFLPFQGRGKFWKSMYVLESCGNLMSGSWKLIEFALFQIWQICIMLCVGSVKELWRLSVCI